MSSPSARMAALREQVRHFVETEAMPREDLAHIHDPVALDRTLAELRPIARAAGLYLPQMPEQYGGLGLSWVDRAELLEEAGRSYLGPGAMNCMDTRGFTTTGDSAFPGEQNINDSLKTFIAEGGTVFCCRFGLSLHGLREEDLIEGVIPAHPLDVQDAVIHYANKGAIINSTYNL